jgi:hypothetical protein
LLKINGTILPCSSSTGDGAIHPATEHWERDASSGISASHPESWRVSRFKESGSFLTGLLFLSNQTVASPCTTTSAGTHISCSGLPRTTLQPQGLVIAWFRTGMPGVSLLAHAVGRPTRIAGYRAKIANTSPSGTCQADGGTVAIHATIATGPGANNLQMSACLSHPSAEQRQQVMRSLRSLRS